MTFIVLYIHLVVGLIFLILFDVFKKDFNKDNMQLIIFVSGTILISYLMMFLSQYVIMNNNSILLLIFYIIGITVSAYIVLDLIRYNRKIKKND